MKVLSVLFIALLGAGCASPSRYANDPRAFVVGPEYLDDIAEYPRDKHTQYYYPIFAVSGFTNSAASTNGTSTASSTSSIDALLIDVPSPTEAGKQSMGKGWPYLEQTGIPFSFVAKH
jgi:hypothetical protein